MNKGVAPLLVLPGGKTPVWRAANDQCATAQRYLVSCPPDPGSTRGEARLARDLARQNRLGLIIVVTSRYNLTRARLDFDRCLGAGFGMASSTAPVSVITKIRRTVDEWNGWVSDGLLHRSC
jgi:hypothetical protein